MSAESVRRDLICVRVVDDLGIRGQGLSGPEAIWMGIELGQGSAEAARRIRKRTPAAGVA